MKFFASPILWLAVVPVALFVAGCSEKTPQAPELLEQETQSLEQSLSRAEMFMLSAKCNEMVIEKFRASWEIGDYELGAKSQLGRSLRCYGFQKKHKTYFDRAPTIEFVLIDGLTGEVLDRDAFDSLAPDEFLIGVEKSYTKKMAE
jgi:hypothetical protein